MRWPSLLGTRRLGRAWIVAGWLLVAVATSGCQARYQVFVTVEEDGSGLVETVAILDREATEAILDVDEGGLVLGDLAQSGWTVSRPERSPDGSFTVTANKAFGTTSQFTEIMGELSGSAEAPGLFDDFRLVRTKTFARVEYRVEGSIDTSDGLATFSDPELEDALGRTLEEIATTYGARPDDIDIELEIVIPGEIQGQTPPEVIEANESATRARWAASLGDPDPTPVEVSSATREVSALVLRGAAVVAGVLAGLVVFAQLLRILWPDRRRRPRTPTGRSPRNPATGPNPVVVVDDPDAAPPASRADPGPRVVALDGLGVLWGRGGDDVSRVLISFARERASRVTDDEIGAKARQLELGRITTAEFWASIGVDGDPAALDADYLAQLQLTPGVIRYLRGLRDRGIRVACITNDPPEWASRIKLGHSLDPAIDWWVVSGTVGVRKPDRPIYEVLRRVTEEPPWAIQVVDDELDNLDAARAYGFDTLWFNGDAERSEARDHAILRSFGALEDEPADPEPTSST